MSDNNEQIDIRRKYIHLTEQEILNLPKQEHKELFLVHRMPEGYNTRRDRKTIMFLECMYRDGYDIGSSWQKNQDQQRIDELEYKLTSLQVSKENTALKLEVEKYREALQEITKTNWMNGKYFGRSSAQLHIITTEIAEQALKEN